MAASFLTTTTHRDDSSLLRCVGTTRRVTVSAAGRTAHFLLTVDGASLNGRAQLECVDHGESAVPNLKASLVGDLFGRQPVKPKANDKRVFANRAEGKDHLLGNVVLFNFGWDGTKQGDSRKGLPCTGGRHVRHHHIPRRRDWAHVSSGAPGPRCERQGTWSILPARMAPGQQPAQQARN